MAAASAVLALRAGVSVQDPWLFPLLVILPGLVATGLALSLVGSPTLRANTLLLAGTAVIALYATEALLHLRGDEPQTQGRAATGDTGSQLQAVRDLRAAGVPAWLTISASDLRLPPSRGGPDVRVDGETVIPLCNVRNRLVVHCNETGTFTRFRTDELGFNNPPGLWGGPVDVVALGDSFIQGACVDTSQTLVANIRRTIPRTLGVGLDAFGPLSMLAALEEYIAAVRPRDVLWFYFEWNDLRDLHQESEFPRLREYLDATGSQQLRDRADEIDRQLVNYIENQIADVRLGQRARRPGLSQSYSVPDALRLLRLRRMLALDDLPGRLRRCCDLDTFEAALQEAKRNVDSWNGRLHMVYLPSAPRYYNRGSSLLDENVRARARVLRAAERAGIPVVDVLKAFAEQGRPRESFHDARSHYNARGYRIAAEAVLAHLEAFRAPSAAGR